MLHYLCLSRKTVLTFLGFFYFVNFSFSQNVYEKFIDDLGMYDDVKGFVSNYVDTIHLVRYRKDPALADRVKAKIDLSDHFKGMEKVLKKYYSKKDIKQIYKDSINQNFPEKPLKYEEVPEVTKGFYNNSYKLGQSLYAKVEYILGENLKLNRSSRITVSIDDLKGNWINSYVKITLHFKTKNNCCPYFGIVTTEPENNQRKVLRSSKFYLYHKSEQWKKERYNVPKYTAVHNKKRYILFRKSTQLLKLKIC